jgi:hypothetical protein
MKNLALAEKKETSVAPISATGSIFFDPARFERAKDAARVLAASTMLPDHFRGGSNMGNIMIALDLAERMRANPFMVMQNMYIVHGKPGLEAKLIIALLNQSGRFTPLKYKFEGEGDDYGCIAYTTEIRTGEVLEGPKVSWKMVRAEGWDKKQGSKWLTIPDLMYRYRAAAFFQRVYAPEVSLGMSMVDEIQDSIEMESVGGGRFQMPEETRGPDPEAVKQLFENEFNGRITGDVTPFIASCSKEFGKTEAEIMSDAIEDPENFLAGYKSWCGEVVDAEMPAPDEQNTAQAASSPESGSNVPEEDKDPAREEYINLRSAGFSTWVYKNKGRITSDEFTDEHRREIEEKWGKLYPNDPYPLAVVAQPEAPEHQGKMGDWRTDDSVWEAMLTDAEETLGHALFTKAIYEYKLEKHLTKSPDPVTLRGAERELMAKKLNAQVANMS